MIINDLILGEFEITEPVLQDIINSETMQKTKGFSMGGYYPGYFRQVNKPKWSRFEHGLGVMCLLRKYNASIEEQISGLIHDVSHCAFSHVVEYLDEDSTENQKSHKYQDSIHKEFVKNSEISTILEKHGFDVDYILDDKNFPLAENSLPDICADRIEYALRGSYIIKIASREEIDIMLDGLIAHNNEFCFKDEKSAGLFAETFWNYDQTYVSGRPSGILFFLSSKLIRMAMEKEYIKFEDLYNKPEIEIISSLEELAKQDAELQKLLDVMQLTPINFNYNDKENGKQIFVKIRRVDPKILIDDKLVRYSEISKDFKKRITSTPKYRDYFLSYDNDILEQNKA